MTLAQEIAKFQAEMAGEMPPDVAQLFARKTEELIETGIARQALHEGDALPAFTLPDIFGKTVASSQLLEKGALVLSFYRGSWCPYCNLELNALQRELPRIEAAGGQLVAISPELPDKSLSLVEKHALTFQVLSDVGNRVARQFGLVFSMDQELRPVFDQFGIHLPDHNGDENWELPLPATYVIGNDGRIAYAFVNADYTKRAEPEDIIAALNRPI